MHDFQEDYYGVLGVEEKATPEEIRKAYLKLAKKLHPDRFPNDEAKRAEAQVEFSKVTRAHDTLSDPKQREEYDAIRMLAKNKLNVDAAAAGGEAAPAASAAPEQKTETREQWAAKHSARAKDMLKRQKFPEAETAIKEAIRLCPGNALYHVTLAEIQMARGWRTLALTSAQAALKIDPNCAEARKLEIRLKAGKTTGAQVKPGAPVAKPGAPAAKPDVAAGGKKGFLDQLKDLLNKKM